jgi:tetratricopeptide (TPR) repeat protein
MFHLGNLNCFLGNAEEALRFYAKARELDSFFVPANFWRMQGIAHFTAGRLGEAIACFRYSPVIPYWARGYLAACHALIGEKAEAADCTAQILAMAPDFSLNRFAAKEPLRRKEDTARLIDGMRKAGLPE